MAEINPPLYLDQDDAYGADELGLPYRDIMGEGIVGSGDLAVTASTGLKSSVAAGAAWVTGDDDATRQPTYRLRNDAAVLLQHDAADATNPRIDLVIAEVLDSAFSGVSKLWRLRAVKGTAAASPAAPALPSNAIRLAEVRINAGSGTITSVTDKRTRAAVGGGAALGSRITTSAYSGGPPASPTDGDIWNATDVDGNGTRWSFQYNAGSASAYKWEFIGGSDVYVVDTTARACAAAASFADITSGTATLTIARAGEYDCSVYGILHNTGGSAAESDLGLSINGTDPGTSDYATVYSGAVGPQADGSWRYFRKTIAAGGVVKARYMSQLTSTFTNVKVAVIPRRIS